MHEVCVCIFVCVHVHVHAYAHAYAYVRCVCACMYLRKCVFIFKKIVKIAFLPAGECDNSLQSFAHQAHAIAAEAG